MSREPYEIRADDGPPDPPGGAVPLHHLSTKQRAVLTLIDQYERFMTEPCPASWLGRRLAIDRSTVLDHLRALHGKGWLRTPNAPASLRRDDGDPLKLQVPTTTGGSAAA